MPNEPGPDMQYMYCRKMLTWVSDGKGAHPVQLTTSCAKVHIVCRASSAAVNSHGTDHA